MNIGRINNMNTYVIVLKNGEQITIKANDFEKNDTRVCFKVDKENDVIYRVAIFMNNNIAGFYIKEYEANGENVSNC